MPDLNRYGLGNINNNEMTRLLNKIELILQLRSLPLPDDCNKEKWAEIIYEHSIPTFSNYFPYEIQDIITPDLQKDGYFYIDQHLPTGTRIIGVKDIDWLAYRSDSRFDRYGINLDAQTWMTRQYAIDDIAMTQVGTDLISLFDLGIYIEFVPPNKIRLTSVSGNPVSRFRPFPIRIYIEHPGLHTISPSMMESFIKICLVDVATLVYGTLKFYDGMDTVYATLDLKLDVLQEWASPNKRDEVLKEYDDAHTTTASDYPIMMTV